MSLQTRPLNPAAAPERRLALITGVSRQIGIGAAIARALAADGLDVFTTYYRPFDKDTYADDTSEQAEQIIETLRAMGAQAHGFEADLSDPEVAHQLFEVAESIMGRPVDVLINNAAFDREVDLLGLTPKLMDAHYAVNVRGTALLCAEFLRRHTGKPGGRIINLTSGQGLTPMPDNLPYAISKGAIEALTLSIMPTVSAKGITVNAVDPGPTDSGWMNADLRARLSQQMPFGRVGVPNDAASLIRFLVSPQGGWITGQIIRSRGGF